MIVGDRLIHIHSDAIHILENHALDFHTAGT